MQKVNEILTPENSIFNEFSTSYAALYHELFSDSIGNDADTEALDMQLLVNCGERYASPLLTHYTIDKIVSFIVTKYGDSWQRCKAALTAEYSVLQPYHVTQTTTGEKAATNATESESQDKTGIVGFDSVTPTDNTVDTNNNSVNISQNETNNTTIETIGNNGNVSNADLIKNELEVRQNSFISLVINDIQTQLTLDIY